MTVVSLAKLKKPFEAYRGDAPYLFVSYSHQDKEAVYIELVRLKKLGFNVWYDEGISPGSRWSDDLAERIANCALFLYYVTPQSVASANCQDEANFVLEAGNPFLAVHLEETELPPGLQLRMGSRQAILRYELEPEVYRSKLYAAIASQAREVLQADLRQGFRLGAYRVRPLTGDVTGSEGQSQHVEPKVMDVFVHLAEHAGDLVTRDQLLDAVWSGQVAADELLTRAISELRRVLHKDGDAKFIETVPKRGYRLIGDIQPTEDGPLDKAAVASVETRASTVVPTATKPAEAPKEQSKRRNIVGIGLGALATITVGTAIQQFWPVAPPPVVNDYNRLTEAQIFFPPASSPFPLVADESRLYFNTVDTNWMAIRQLSQAGGEAIKVDVPFGKEIGFARPITMTPDKSHLLFGTFLPGKWESGFWTWPVVGGSPRHLADVGGDGVYSPDGSKLLYVTGDENIFLANPDLSESRTLLSAPGRVHWPRYSPDADRIRFSAETGTGYTDAIYEISAAGTGLNRVLPTWDSVDHCCGSWTPDGEYFVFQAVRDGQTQLWAIHEQKRLFGARRSEPVQITTSALEFRRPTIASDGERIFAVGWQLRGEVVHYDDPSERFEPIPGLENLSAEWLSWSRDEEWITYVSHPGGDMWRSRRDGTDRLQLTFPPMRAMYSAWSPDRQTIAFEGQMPGQPWQIYLVSADGRNLRPITEEESGEAYPTWSPDGKYLAFDAGKDKGIQVLDMGSGSIEPLDRADGLRFPQWSPGGNYIAAKEDRHLQLYDVVTSQYHELSDMDDFEWDYNYYWGRDEQYLYFYGPFWLEENRWLYRFDVRDKSIDKVAQIPTARAVWGVLEIWVGVTPGGSAVVLRDTGIHHIYALDWPLD